MLLVVGRHTKATRLNIHRISLRIERRSRACAAGISSRCPDALGAAMTQHWEPARRALPRSIRGKIDYEVLWLSSSGTQNPLSRIRHEHVCMRRASGLTLGLSGPPAPGPGKLFVSHQQAKPHESAYKSRHRAAGL
jgi:hypothetical protein